MNDPLIARFADACGATAPLDLRVDLADGGVLAEGVVEQPFTLVGRDDACDVTLTDPEVNPRHTWLQVLGGRVYAVDLGSRTGLIWPSGESGCGWLNPESPVRIGPFRLSLRKSPARRPTTDPDSSPLQGDLSLTRSRPAVALDFRNGKRAKDRWTVNRLITLVGRSEACKIHLNADDICAYHCGLVLTPSGLWVVDLSGRGVVVNGERMRVAPLTHGAELWVGRFLIGCHYPGVTNTPAAGRPGTIAPPAPLPGLSSISRAGPRSATIARVAPPIPEDEVPLGEAPPSDPLSGLPSSHIMADAFRVLISGPISSPILVTGSNPLPPVVPVPPARPPEPGWQAPADPPITPPPAGEPPVIPLLHHLAEIHGQMFDQFQQSLLLMVQVFGQVHREHSPTMQQELSCIQELNAELARLQSEVTRVALADVLAVKNRVGPSDQTPVPGLSDAPPLGRMTTIAAPSGSPEAAAAIHDWVVERIDTLQKERRSRWQKLVGLFAPPADRA